MLTKYGDEMSYHYQDFHLSRLFCLIHHLLEIPTNLTKKIVVNVGVI